MATPNRDRRAYVLDECGGGHAGHLVRLVAAHGDLDGAVIDLLAELVGRIQEAEVRVGKLEGELLEEQRRADELGTLMMVMVEHASIQDELQDRAEAAIRAVRDALEVRRG
jgi:tRNA U34 5-carboxymethylaminomethyl modifying enzyme MnmG/GidA